MPTVGMTRKDGISQHLKAYVKQGRTTVVGYIGEGAMKEIAAHWESPFENDTGGGGAVGNATALVQTATDITTVSKLSSVKTFQGIESYSMTLPLHFKAFSNPKAEVNDPIMYLEQFASPDLNNILAGGRIPAEVVIDVGRRFKIVKCLIESVSSELDAPRDKNGYFLHNTVSLQLVRSDMVNSGEVQSLYS